MSEMQILYTLCYPRLAEADRKFIDEFRSEHDIPHCEVVAPHFTIVFGCRDVPLIEYREHVSAVAHAQSVISFSCRYAMLGNDVDNGNYYVFLTPDEGYGEISKLHDKLYRGPLAPYLRLDIPYIPHIGIATLADAARVKALCDNLNATSITIDGEIDSITLCSYDGSKITNLESFACQI